MVTLDPGGGVVQVGPVRIVTPGVGGQVEVVLPTPGQTRSQSHISETVAQALRSADLRVVADIELTGLTAAGAGPGGPTGRAPRGTRGGDGLDSAGGAEAHLLAEIPQPGEQFGQVVLLVDEDGVLTWQVPEEAQRGDGPQRVRGATTLTYRIPLRQPVQPEMGDTRGPLGWLGRKVLKVLVYPLLDDALGRVGRYLAKQWEDRHRPHALRQVTGPGGFAGPPVDWTAVTAGPALLLIHGTFSTTAAVFSSLPPALVTSWVQQRYAGRVIAFDHPTVSVDPTVNARWFVEQFAAGTRDRPTAELVLDVVTHSRGGLVARALAEQQPRLPFGDRTLQLRSAVLVAPPNAGTVLADSDHLGTLLDAFTNVLDLVPDVGAIDALQMVLEVVKQVATGVVKGLDGLMAMNPSGRYLREANQDAAERAGYAAIASDFEPVPGNLRQRAVDLLVDAVFGSPNDLVVPRDGAWTVGTKSLVPLGRRLSIGPERAVSHNSYFGLDVVTEHLGRWLGIPPGM